MSKRTLLWFCLVAALATFSRWRIGRGARERCSLDGLPIMPVYRVDLLVGDRTVRRFCCLTCARGWPQPPAWASWTVRDEMTGRELDATRAFFVVSRSPIMTPRRGHVHVFKEWTDAISHADRFQGSFVPNPLARRPGEVSPRRRAQPGAARVAAGGRP